MTSVTGETVPGGVTDLVSAMRVNDGSAWTGCTVFGGGTKCGFSISWYNLFFSGPFGITRLSFGKLAVFLAFDLKWIYISKYITI